MNQNALLIVLVVLVLKHHVIYADILTQQVFNNKTMRFVKSLDNLPASGISGDSIAKTSVFEIFKKRILADLLQEKYKEVSKRDADVASYLAQLKSDGAFTNIDYSSSARTHWPPLAHLDRLMEMGLGYTNPESSYYQNRDLKEKMDVALGYWQNRQPRSNNWFYNQIAEPKLMGQYLILIQSLGHVPIPDSIFRTSIARLAKHGGSPSLQAGANRIDVALHYVYRACLLEDPQLLKEAMTSIYSPLEKTEKAEGIQFDNSYTQHGRQLHIGSYGQVFLEGVTKASMYAVHTDYALPIERLEVLSVLAKESYANIFRGAYIYFNTLGRAVTRPHATKKIGQTEIFERLKILDTLNAKVYDNLILRLQGKQPPSYQRTPWSNHYYQADYTIHNQPAYSVDLRMVSQRTARNEYLRDNGEGIQQYFMSDGAMGIFVDGDEYADIFPVWNWSKIPGVTAPEFIKVPEVTSYIQQGTSPFVGGVTDGLNTVSVYQYQDVYRDINSSAHKAWFFFDNEIVCLGSKIQSTSGFQVNTTLNQTLLKGPITLFSGGEELKVSFGNYEFNKTLEGVHHGKVAYFFPDGGSVHLAATEKTGAWNSINANYQERDLVTKDVFTLTFNHGVNPLNESYAYILVPGISALQAEKYKSSKIEIVENSEQLQAVYHQEQNAYGLVFHEAGSFEHNGFFVKAEAGCVILIKNVSAKGATVFVADPQNGTTPIHLSVKTLAMKLVSPIVYRPSAPYLGQSLKYEIY